MAAGKSGSIWASLGLKTDEFQKGVNKAKGSMKGMESSMATFGKSIGGLMAGAFAVDSLISFGKEASELAGKLTGIEAAFKKIDDGNLLDNLRKATKGTVSDLRLMQSAVQAENLGLPVKQLGTYFEFARRTAKATGESVDYLVDSIVKGIGRKSPLILDNLGISTTQLNEQLKLTPDFAEAVGIVIEQKMAKAGEDIDTAAESSAQLAAQWDNTKATIGQLINKGLVPLQESLGVVVDGINEMFNVSENDNWVSFLNSYSKAWAGVDLGVKTFEETLSKVIDTFAKLSKEQLKSEEGLRSFAKTMLLLGVSTEEAVKKYKQLVGAKSDDGDVKNRERTVALINEEIKGQQEMLDFATNRGQAIAIQERIAKLEKEKERILGNTKALKEQNKILEDRKKKLKETYEEAEKVNKNLAAGFGLIDGSDLVVDLSGVEVKNGDDFWDFADDLEPPNIDMAMDEALSSTKTKMDKMREMMASSSQAIYDTLENITVQGIATIGAAMGTAMAGGDFGGIILGFAQMIGGAVSSLGQQLIALGVAELAIMDALKTFGASNPALVIAGGAALVAIGAAMKSNMSQSVGFADGGLVTGSVFANIGEGIGTNSANPEVIAPLDKLKNFIDPQQNAGMGGNVSFRIEGNTLVGILDRQAKTTKYGR